MPRLYIPVTEVRRGDVLIKSYGDLPVFEVYETRRGTVAICVDAPWGQSEYRHRRAKRVLVERSAEGATPSTAGA